MSVRIGIDVGGTFTDFVLADRRGGRIVHHKEPSTPGDPARAVHLGIAALLARTGVVATEIELVVHGTTLALNAILQRRGARVALVVSTGNRDIMEIARLRIANSYDFFATREPPIVPRDLVFELDARLDADGTVAFAPKPAAIDALATRLRATAADAIAVMFINAYRDPPFEQAIAQRLQGSLPDIAITASTSIWPEMREYERALIAALNAYVAPIMRDYYARLAAGFRATGLAAPLTVTANNGGTIDIETARARPIDSILSGPASGVVAALGVARPLGLDRLVTFDMGGTSTDISIVTGAMPEITNATLIGEIPLILPVVNVGAIGAGGGSIVHVDRQRVLKVGPRSAGADPGPACYARGGAEAAITDCYLACGILDAERFLGGRLRLSTAAAHHALVPIAQHLGYEGADATARAASAAIRVATSVMATEMRKLLARRGATPGAFVLVPYGGAGPTHANFLAAEAGMERILIPPGPGTFCALGAIVADLRRDFVRSTKLTLDGSQAAGAQLAAMVAALETDGRNWIAGLAHMTTGLRCDLAADLRYPGQAFDLTLTLQDITAGPELAAQFAAAFHREHDRLYGFNERHSPVHMTRLALSAIGRLPDLARSAAPDRSSPAQRSTRRVLLGEAWREVQIVARDSLGRDDEIAGPAIVEQPDTTTVVLEGWVARCCADGSLLIARRG
jgi:N-methylhydantoinase A